MKYLNPLTVDISDLCDAKFPLILNHYPTVSVHRVLLCLRKKYQISFPGTGKANGPFSPTNIVLNSIILNVIRKRVKIFVAGRIWDVKFGY